MALGTVYKLDIGTPRQTNGVYNHTDWMSRTTIALVLENVVWYSFSNDYTDLVTQRQLNVMPVGGTSPLVFASLCEPEKVRTDLDNYFGSNL